MDRQDRCHAYQQEQLARCVPGGTVDRWDGVELALTGLDHPMFNTAFVTAPPTDPGTLGKLVGRLRDASVPFTVHVPTPVLLHVEEDLRAVGLDHPETVPGMSLAPRSLHPLVLPGVSVRRVERRHLDDWIGVASEGFNVTRDVGEAITPEALLDAPGVDLWLAEEDGEPAASAMTLGLNGTVGVSAVAVPPRSRGRGLGAAITSAAVMMAVDRHPVTVDSVVLQSSPLGYSVYRRLGFRTTRPYHRFGVHDVEPVGVG